MTFPYADLLLPAPISAVPPGEVSCSCRPFYTHLGCGRKCPLPCSPVYVLPEMSLNPLLTEGSSPILFVSVIYSSKVILIESQVGEEEPMPTLSFGTHLFHFNPFGRPGLLVLALSISGLKCPEQSLYIASTSLRK